MITMPLPQLPLSQLPSQNPQRPATSGHAIRVQYTHSSTRPFAPLSTDKSASLLCSPTPPFPWEVLGCFHFAYPRLHLGVAVHPVHNRLTIPFIPRVGHCPASGMPNSRRGNSLGFLVGLIPLGSVFFPTPCFMDPSRLPCEVFVVPKA